MYLPDGILVLINEAGLKIIHVPSKDYLIGKLSESITLHYILQEGLIRAKTVSSSKHKCNLAAAFAS